MNFKVESKAHIEVYPLHIPDEQRSPRSEQFQKFYPVESDYERPDQLQQQRQVEFLIYQNSLSKNCNLINSFKSNLLSTIDETSKVSFMSYCTRLN